MQCTEAEGAGEGRGEGQSRRLMAHQPPSSPHVKEEEQEEEGQGLDDHDIDPRALDYPFELSASAALAKQ